MRVRDSKSSGKASATPLYGILLLVVVLLVAAGEVLLRYRDAPMEQASWLIGDCRHYRDVARSLLERGTVDYRVVNPSEVRRYEPGSRDLPTPSYSNVSLTVDGVMVPQRPLLFPLVLLLPYALLREPGLLLFNVAQCVLLVMMVYWLVRRYVSEWAALIAACCFLADSPVRNFMYNVSPDVFGAVLVLGGVLCVWRPEAGALRLLAGGALLGLSLWLRPVYAVGLAALLPAVVESLNGRQKWAGLGWVGLGLLVGSSGWLILNTLWFGGPFVTSYDRVLVIRDGTQQLASLRDAMNRPFWPSLYPTFLGPGKSFLGSAPHWPLFLFVWPALFAARRAEAVALAVVIFAPLFFLVRFDYWDVSHYGNRFMFLSGAVSSVGVGLVIEAILRRRWLSVSLVPEDVSRTGR
jgi:hypothetical protein